jgi:hypothetical protein
LNCVADVKPKMECREKKLLTVCHNLLQTKFQVRS